MAQYKVPQDVQREDKIIGPFTLRQFLFLIGASMGGYMAYTLFARIIGGGNAFMIGFIIFAGIAAFAVIQIKGMSLPEYLTAFILYSTKPRKRVWQKDIYSGDIAYLKPIQENVTKEKQQNSEQVKSRLDQLSYVLDTRGWSGPVTEQTAPEVPAVDAPVEATQETVEETVPEVPTVEATEVQVQETVEETVPEVPAVDAPATATQETVEQTDKVLSARTRIVPPTEQKQEQIEKLLQIQEKRERMIHQEMNKMEERLRNELREKFTKEAQKEIIEQKQTLKELKSTVTSLEKETAKNPDIKRVKKAKIRVAPIPQPQPVIEDYSKIMNNRIATSTTPNNHMNISVDESKLDDVLSGIDNPTTDSDFDKLSEAILAKKHTNKHAKIIKDQAEEVASYG